MYLWHPFALAVVLSVGLEQRFLSTWALSMAIAAVSWVLVERHFLRTQAARRSALGARNRAGRAETRTPARRGHGPDPICLTRLAAVPVGAIAMRSVVTP